jgi:hypothetical protein
VPRAIVVSLPDCSSGQRDAVNADMHESNERQPDRRTASDPPAPALPGFYRVRTGSLVEIGDQTLDERGRPYPISLDQVGRQVTHENIVLRIDRRQHHD